MIRHGNLVRSTQWAGLRSGDVVVVDGVKERRQSWVFVAHVLNEATSEEWIDVRGGRVGEAKGRSFRPELIYPSGAKRGSRLVGLPLAVAPQLPLVYVGDGGGAPKHA
ncbi:MAG: hypothetical protein WA786_10255 [Acidimicrobiales bacterium]